jgi:hypothetical protein
VTGYSKENLNLLQALADHFERVPRIMAAAKRDGKTVEQEAMEIATGLVDIKESADRLFTDLVPRLLKVPSNRDAADDFLNEIGEEYRHILYHIRDAKLFRYLLEEK